MITSHLDSWFANFKVTASPGQRAAGGRVDPRTKKPLFTEDTKSAIENSKSSVNGIRDAIPKEELYLPSAPSKNAKSQLTRWLNRRGAEWKSESFHLHLSHFANSKMRKELADLLGLIGTALHNLKIRERHKIDCMTAEERARIPFDFRGVPRHVNHSRLAFINQLGHRAGVPHDFH
jgi:Asp-tRNA(Asn)/Glu-tRNA(Gln) amidotransferase A subunit family amidase